MQTDIILMAREECPYTSDEMRGAFYEGFLKGSAAEREACAKVCEELDKKSADGEWGDYLAGWSDGTDDCAAAIRTRGQQ